MAAIEVGQQQQLFIGNLNARRDWGHARDYVEGMWRVLQAKKPDDYILATNETHTVREFVEEVAKELDISLKWTGKGVKEKGIDKKTGRVIIEVDPKYFRPAEVDILIGDYSKAKKGLGWKPNVKFKELVKIMTEYDFKKEEHRNRS